MIRRGNLVATTGLEYYADVMNDFQSFFWRVVHPWFRPRLLRCWKVSAGDVPVAGSTAP